MIPSQAPIFYEGGGGWDQSLRGELNTFGFEQLQPHTLRIACHHDSAFYLAVTSAAQPTTGDLGGVIIFVSSHSTASTPSYLLAVWMYSKKGADLYPVDPDWQQTAQAVRSSPTALQSSQHRRYNLHRCTL
jgi:hypothetical protein